LTISGIRQLTQRIRAYELRHADGESLPIYQAGAHIRVPIALADGSITSRTYSLTEAPDDPDCYHIAVLRVDDGEGEGGSSALHDSWQLGSRINVEAPENYFPLHDGDRPALLIAGGIGITPIKAMGETLAARGTTFQLHTPAERRRTWPLLKTCNGSFPIDAGFISAKRKTRPGWTYRRCSLTHPPIPSSMSVAQPV
jgi:ferredoxin-NADP reductase